ncbi:MAG: hypothetical protein ACTSQE_15445 [Candidatus Heimdallarchaeaceae archaeon]
MGVKSYLKDAWYVMKTDKKAFVTGAVPAIVAGIYRTLVGIKVKSHPEVGINPLSGKPNVVGTYKGDLFNSWWDPGWNGENYVPGPCANGLSAHDTLIYNTTTGVGGVVTGLAFALGVGTVGWSAYGAMKRAFMTPEKMKEYMEKHEARKA